MITTQSPTATRYSTSNNGYDGVVRISANGSVGTGTLLYDGRAILTAAHLLEGVTTAIVTFLINGVIRTYTSSTIETNPDADTLLANNDLAIIWLDEVPVAAERYNLYRDNEEIGQEFIAVGYGQYGLGSSSVRYDGSAIQRLLSYNTFDVTGETLKEKLGSEISWTPATGTQLIADFDNGTYSNDALGQLVGEVDLGLGANEGLIAPGDSGGPAFIDGLIAGVASYTASISNWLTDPDVDSITNSSFGEIAAWQRVSNYQRWIDQTLRKNYIDAPTTIDEVKTQVSEGNNGISYAYFMVSFNGDRALADDILSVDYTTRDGTATAGQDYIAVTGTLNIYDDESYAVIAVEIIGDTTIESDETFYLDITNPEGGIFANGVVTLTAMRTILNDDGVV